MKRISELIVYQNNRLVIRCYERENPQRRYSQGKRVPRDCPIPKDIRHEYVQNGTIAALKLFMHQYNKTLAEAWDLLKPYTRAY